jgi:hypothetical protein
MKPWTKSVPMLAGLALVGTAAGVSLGHSAVSEINPLYYSEAPTRFHGDGVPLRPDWTEPQLASAAAPVQGLGSGCFGCGEEPAAYAAPAVVTYTDSWRADAERAAAPVAPHYVEDAPDPERERVVRYSSYPITEDERPAEPEAAEEPAAAEFVTE